MKYYIVDDNIATVKSLVNIIEKRGIGQVCGYATDPAIALEEICGAGTAGSTRTAGSAGVAGQAGARQLAAPPDIVLVDLLMSGMDGITLVRKIRERIPGLYFVMISKVTDKSLVEEAYAAGIEFFINKPVSLLEVEKVLGNVASQIKMSKIMSSIRVMMDGDAVAGAGQIGGAPAATDPTADLIAEPEVMGAPGKEEVDTEKLDVLFSNLGMLGEKGTQDIREIYRYMVGEDLDYSKDVLRAVARARGDSTKNVEQRVRRALKKGLATAASMGLDDYDSDGFSIYAEYVFDFNMLRDEMNYQAGKSAAGGRVKISKFMEGLQLYSRSV